jgi:hypothetical protein
LEDLGVDGRIIIRRWGDAKWIFWLRRFSGFYVNGNETFGLVKQILPTVNILLLAQCMQTRNIVATYSSETSLSTLKPAWR